MNTYTTKIGTYDTKNPDNCRIVRVENGWLLDIGQMDFGRPLATYVFTSQGALADFIKTNFRLPPKEDKP